MSGLDRTPWLVRVKADGPLLIVDRSMADSGCLTIPWHVEGHGLLGLSTGTLTERPEPYLLPLELARGAINQLRAHLFEWQGIGLLVPRPVGEKLHAALEQFSAAVVDQDDPASAVKSQAALRIALDASQLLAGTYAEQVITFRRRSTGKLPTLLGGDLAGPMLENGIAAQFLAAFNAARVPMPWGEVEAIEGRFAWSTIDSQLDWCRAQGLKICAGPLLQLDARGLPDWAYLWEDDFDNLLAAAGEFVEATVQRYRGKVDMWQCAARINSSDLLPFSEEENLRLVASLLALIAQLDPQTPVAVSIDQPWGEYMGRRAGDFPPLHFADALVRARLDLKALVLEINLGCFHGATLPRSELELSRLLDYWSMLGMPLCVSLTIPSSDADDPNAVRRMRIPAGSWNAESQQVWASRYVPLILAKPAVQAVYWNQFRDIPGHDFPHAGLMNDQRYAKPSLRTLTTIRSSCLTPPKAE
jgi:hypothetical protein